MTTGFFDSLPTSAEVDQAQEQAQAAVRRGEDLREAAGNLIGETRAKIDRVRKDERLAEDAKVCDIARIKAKANAQVKAFRAEYEASLHRERDELRLQLCTPSRHTTGAERVAVDASFRDALERAQRTPPQEVDRHPLADLFHRATLTGDGLQQRAAMVVALERDDVDVLNAWLESHPGDDTALQRLHDLHFVITDRRETIHRAMRFTGI